MGKWVLRFFGYYFMNALVAWTLLYLYGMYDPFAGYFVLVLPLTVGATTLIMLGIKYKFPDMNRWLFLLLSPVLNVLTVIGLFAVLIMRT